MCRDSHTVVDGIDSGVVQVALNTLRATGEFRGTGAVQAAALAVWLTLLLSVMLLSSPL